MGGGVPRFVRELLRRLDKERFEVHVCSARPLLPEDSVEEIGEHVTRHSLNVVGGTGWGLPGRLVWDLARVFREVRPEVLHTHTGIAWNAIAPDVLSRGIKGKVLDIHTGPDGRQLSWLNTMSQRLMVRRMGYRPIVHSSATRDEVAKAFAIRPDAITLFPLGIDTASFARPGTARREWCRLNDVPQDALVVLYVARLVPVKNVALYLDVARRVLGKIDGAVFLVAGDGPLRDTLESSVRSDGWRDGIRFLGARRDLADVYHACDVYLSTSDYESLPLTIMEAMAAAKPVVATAVGGVVDQVRDGSTGRLCPPGDAGALAHATLELLRDASLRRRLGEAAQERARRVFDIGTMVRKYEELYEALVTRRDAPGFRVTHCGRWVERRDGGGRCRSR